MFHAGLSLLGRDIQQFHERGEDLLFKIGDRLIFIDRDRKFDQRGYCIGINVRVGLTGPHAGGIQEITYSIYTDEGIILTGWQSSFIREGEEKNAKI